MRGHERSLVRDPSHPPSRACAPLVNSPRSTSVSACRSRTHRAHLQVPARSARTTLPSPASIVLRQRRGGYRSARGCLRDARRRTVVAYTSNVLPAPVASGEAFMRPLDGTGLVERVVGRSPGGARRGPLAALLAVTLLGCLFCPLAAAAAAAPNAAAPDFSARTLLARLALRQAELTAGAGVAADDIFGCSVAISGDTALVGARYEATPGKDEAGAAYVFTRSAGVWTQEAKLIAADGAAGDRFGYAVAIAGDTALVGAPLHDVAGQANAGAAYVFTRSAGVWAAEQTLTAADAAAYDAFGYSVALSGDTALVGAPHHDAAGKDDAGAAYVFTRSAGVWTQAAEPVAAAGAAGDRFGYAVAISGDTALVGAPYHDVAGKANAGAASVFTRSGGAWTFRQTLTAGAAGDRFGHAVAIAGDTALLGAPWHAAAGKADAGAAYVFTRSAGAWTRQAKLTADAATTAAGAAGDQFGYSVAVAGDTALVGAPWRDTAGKARAGAAYVFTRSGAAWNPHQTLTAAIAGGDQFGYAVAVAGVTALVGSPFHDTAGMARAGAAYVFLTEPSIARFTPTLGPVGTVVTVTGTGFADATAVTFNGVAALFSVRSATRITATVPAGATSGRIAVTTPSSTVMSAVRFTVIPAPLLRGSGPPPPSAARP